MVFQDESHNHRPADSPSATPSAGPEQESAVDVLSEDVFDGIDVSKFYGKSHPSELQRNSKHPVSTCLLLVSKIGEESFACVRAFTA